MGFAFGRQRVPARVNQRSQNLCPVVKIGLLIKMHQSAIAICSEVVQSITNYKQ